jgi:hypothetical protein
MNTKQFDLIIVLLRILLKAILSTLSRTQSHTAIWLSEDFEKEIEKYKRSNEWWR